MTVRGRTAGYSLIELTVVLALLALSAALAFAAISSRGERRLGAEAEAAMSLLRAAQLSAMTNGRSEAVVIDLERRSISTGDETHAFGGALGLEVTGAEAELDGKRQTVRFYPDGSSSGARIELSSRATTTALRVDWLTGLVRREAAP